ncbi:MAG: molybdopterin molybdotransferase MoeA [Pseudomonadales bacterium]|nr:molybdopterin molybdotransferase MoeA [Pseudomonadales bacterium]
MAENSDWLSVDAAISALLRRSVPVLQQETLALSSSFQRILAQDIRATRAVPPMACSAMDGYALHVNDYQPGKSLLVSQRIAAGQVPEKLSPGTCARIFTGAPVPEGANAVVMQEQVEVDAVGVKFSVMPMEGMNIRAAGHDVARGQQVLQAGMRLGPLQVGLLASLGQAQVQVWERPRAVLFSTGNELLEVHESWRPGCIYNSNRPMLSALLQSWGFEVLDLGIVPDALEVTRQRWREALELQPHVIISSGGVSVGDEDHVQKLLHLEGQLQFWKVAIRPGKPLCVADYGGVCVLGLPGNPMGAWVTLCAVARPFLLKMTGQISKPLHGVSGIAGFERQTGLRQEYWPACEREGRWYMAENFSSGSIWPAAACEGWVVLPPHTVVRPGDAIGVVRTAEWLVMGE